MSQNQTRILCVAPYEGMCAAIESAAQAYSGIQLDVIVGNMEEGQSLVQRLAPNSYDCIISRGGTADLIRQISDLPVVDIRISVYDVLRTMKLAENYTERYAVVGFPTITEPAHTLCSLLNFKMDILTVHSFEDMPRTLVQLKQNGYHMVVCDMIAHDIARNMGLDAFLITSGAESLNAAIDHAIQVGGLFSHLRQENVFLHSIIQGQNGRMIVLEPDGRQFYASPAEPTPELNKMLAEHLREISAGNILRFYYTDHDQLYTITAQQLLIDGSQRYLFYCTPSRIPLHVSRAGIRSMNKNECAYLFAGSFYNLSGALGAQEAEIQSLAGAKLPVIITGEPGTGKEQIARYLYLHSSQQNLPMVTVNCESLTDKSWDFLLDHTSSPLNAAGNTVYFQNFECAPAERVAELLNVIEETGLSRRVRLLFSCATGTAEPDPDILRRCSDRLGCLRLRLPSLRDRTDEIPSLASQYLANLNYELGRQISGFEPRALEMLRQYSWPNNYTQFKNLLSYLASMTTGPYISSTLVADVLSKELSMRAVHTAVPAAYDGTQTLTDLTSEIIQQAIAAHGGNRTAAARQLGISRTTLWRYLRQEQP